MVAEGQQVTLSTVSDVAFGANGHFLYKYGVTSGIAVHQPCVRFRPPPRCQEGMLRQACTVLGPNGFTYVALEGQEVTVSTVSDVAFGGSGHFLYKYGVTGSLACSNATFGSYRLQHIKKDCYVKPDVGPNGFTYAAVEGQQVTVSTVSDVAFGGSGHFLYKYGVTGSLACSNTTFGSDPLQHIKKDCYVKPDVGPNGFTYAAAEGQQVTVSTVSDVAFGGSGHYLYKNGVTGSLTCSNAAFGSDPLPNIKKDCYTRPAAA